MVLAETGGTLARAMHAEFQRFMGADNLQRLRLRFPQDGGRALREMVASSGLIDVDILLKSIQGSAAGLLKGFVEKYAEDQEMLKAMLVFITSSAAIPEKIEAKLIQGNGERMASHTCFSTLDVYGGLSEQDKFNDKLAFFAANSSAVEFGNV